jgi:hypothetical protein
MATPIERIEPVTLTVLAAFNRPDPGPYDHDIELLWDDAYECYRLRFAGSATCWVNPERRHYKSHELRTLFHTEADARAHIARVYGNFAPRVEKKFNQAG